MRERAIYGLCTTQAIVLDLHTLSQGHDSLTPAPTGSFITPRLIPSILSSALIAASTIRQAYDTGPRGLTTGKGSLPPVLPATPDNMSPIERAPRAARPGGVYIGGRRNERSCRTARGIAGIGIEVADFGADKRL